MRDLAQVLPGNRGIEFLRPSVTKGRSVEATFGSLVGAPSGPSEPLFHFQAVGYSKTDMLHDSAIGSMQYSAYNRRPGRASAKTTGLRNFICLD
jgi:hypothetical protein